MPVALAAGFWGLLAGGALVIGAAIAWFAAVPKKVVASIMAFGAGVLISALAFELVDEADRAGGLVPTTLGFLGGAVAYVAANVVLARRGARHRKRTGDRQSSEDEQPGSGVAIAIGALLDGIPESIVLGISLLEGGGVGIAVLAAIFISNLPEGLSSSAGMKSNGRSARYVFGVWTGIALASGIAALLGYLLLQNASPARGGDHRGGGRRHLGDDHRHDDPRSVRECPSLLRVVRHARLPYGIHPLARAVNRRAFGIWRSARPHLHGLPR